jgi:hypothetical protein
MSGVTGCQLVKIAVLVVLVMMNEANGAVVFSG